jgi:hypothetical protein
LPVSAAEVPCLSGGFWRLEQYPDAVRDHGGPGLHYRADTGVATATRFYLLGDEPRLLQDFLDLDALRRYLPVLTADEFVAAVKADSSIAVDNSYHDYMKRIAFMPTGTG